MTEEEIQQLRADVRGFVGRFAFAPEQTVDRGIGHLADFVEFDDRLVYIRPDDDGDPEEWYVIAEPMERHTAEPLARMLNGVGSLLRELDAVRKATQQANDINAELAQRDRGLAATAVSAANAERDALKTEVDRLNKALCSEVIKGDDLQAEIDGLAVFAELQSTGVGSPEFGKAWEGRGCQYSDSNILKVKFGWEMAMAEMAKRLKKVGDG